MITLPSINFPGLFCVQITGQDCGCGGGGVTGVAFCRGERGGHGSALNTREHETLPSSVKL
jgi:hypothetical protein